MSRSKVVWFVLLLVFVAGTVFAGIRGININPRAKGVPTVGGVSDPVAQPPVGPIRTTQTLDTPVGDREQAGTTYYDVQSNGTVGKQIGVDDLNMVHMVWMKGMTSTSSGARNVYYNVWAPDSVPARMLFRSGNLPSGTMINSATRAGYVAMDLLPSGWVFPAFHQYAGTALPRPAAGQDYSRYMGGFIVTQPNVPRENGANVQLLWPKVAVGHDSTIHMIVCESPASGVAGDYQRIAYYRGHPQWDVDGYGTGITWDQAGGTTDWMWMDTVMTIAPDIAASQTTGRVVIAYCKSMDNLLDDSLRSQIHNNVVYRISEDDGHNWSGPINITHFQPPEMDCPGRTHEDSVACNHDTLNAYTDCAVMLAPNDSIHIGFSVQTVFRYANGGVGYYTYTDQSAIYHWSNEVVAAGEAEPVATFFDIIVNADTTALIGAGAWQIYCQRPNFAYDAVSGDMYCVYQQYMPNQSSVNSLAMGDVFVSRSCNKGRTWSQGVNITRTDGGQNASPPNSMDEREPTVANRVTHEGGAAYLHVFYTLDHDAGACVQPNEGTVTLNEVYYQKVPVDSIPLRPLNDPFWPPLSVDSIGFPGFTPADTVGDLNCQLAGISSVHDRNAAMPDAFRLYQNYPNPFNPTTDIQFDLPRSARVTLKVYNVLGQNVATLFDKQMLTAGAKVVPFDGSKLASGIYMYRLEVDGRVQTMKMVLMK